MTTPREGLTDGEDGDDGEDGEVETPKGSLHAEREMAAPANAQPEDEAELQLPAWPTGELGEPDTEAEP